MKIKGRITTVMSQWHSASVIIQGARGTRAEDFEKYLDMDLSIEIKKPSKKRSLDSNAYMWVLLDKIAAVLNTDKESVYLDMLERYGVFTPVVVRPSAVERLKSEWRTVKEIGPVEIGGEVGIQLLCFYGSHGYDQREMNRLISGVVNECHDLDIETLTDEELDAMNSRWGS